MAQFTLIHTADWQIGTPFAYVEDPHRRALLAQERLLVVERIAAAAAEHDAAFVVVCGDLFDSDRPTKSVVAAATAAIGRIGRPVYAIPGNHDHGGPGSVWHQEFYRQERDAHAPNLHVLLEPAPVEVGGAVLLPCPLQRRHVMHDPTAWLRATDLDLGAFGDRPRVVLAHGSVTDFGPSGMDDEDDPAGTAINRLDLERLPDDATDYIALGDWHGMKQVAPKAWYSGAPERDAFPPAGEHRAEQVLLVRAQRGAAPQVRPITTGRTTWTALDRRFAEDADLDRLEHDVTELMQGRVDEHLLRLELDGQLGIAAHGRLERLLDTWAARLLHLRVKSRPVVAPTDEELEGLRVRPTDPVIAGVAERLAEMLGGDAETSAVARLALRELHLATHAG